MTVEWVEYPISVGNEDELMTITWSDGSTDLVPANNGDGETIIQLPRLMESLFKVQFFNCFVGQSGRFIDIYPELFRSASGALVLRVTSEESFDNAFICKERDPAVCLLSWLSGDVRRLYENDSYPPEGSQDDHWVKVRDVLALIGSGFLDEIPPIVFDADSDDEIGDESSDPKFEIVELPWWYPPNRQGPNFAYPACLFQEQTYEAEAEFSKLDEMSSAVSVAHRLDDLSWEKLFEGCFPNSVIDRIVEARGRRNHNLAKIQHLCEAIGSTWLKRWNDFH